MQQTDIMKNKYKLIDIQSGKLWTGVVKSVIDSWADSTKSSDFFADTRLASLKIKLPLLQSKLEKNFLTKGRARRRKTKKRQTEMVI